MLRLPHLELEDYVLGLLEDKNEFRLERHLRDFPNCFLIDKVSDSDDSQGEVAKAILDSITVFGVVFINYGQHELYRMYLRSLQHLVDDAQRRLSDSRQLKFKTAIWFEILQKLYILGATLVREDRLDWLSDCFGQSIPWKHGQRETSSWIRYLQIESLPDAEESNNLLHQICNDIMESSENSYFFKQFAHAEDSLKSCICQFDFLHCLHISFCADDKVNFSAFPFFGVYYLDRTAPAIERVIDDTNLRKKLFGEQSSDEVLAEAILRYCTYARSRSSAWGVRWNFSRPQTIVSFVDRHGPEYLKNNPHFAL